MAQYSPVYSTCFNVLKSRINSGTSKFALHLCISNFQSPCNTRFTIHRHTALILSLSLAVFLPYAPPVQCN